MKSADGKMAAPTRVEANKAKGNRKFAEGPSLPLALQHTMYRRLTCDINNFPTANNYKFANTNKLN